MNHKKRITLLIGLVCMAVCVILSGCVGETTPTEPVQQTTAPVTEAPTQPVTEAPTEEPTEPTTEAPTEEPTEAPTEAPTEPSSGSSDPNVNTGTGGGYTPVEPEPTEPEPTEPPVIEVAAPGSETNAYFENIPAYGEFSTVQIPAGESVHYVLKTPGTFLCIEDPELSVTLDGQTADAADGVYQLPADSTKMVRLMLTNQGSEAKQVSVQILDAPGSQTNPLKLSQLFFAADLAEGDADGLYYSYTADADGELTMNLSGSAADLVVTVGQTTVKLSESEDILRLPVKAEDQVQIQVLALTDDQGNIPAAQVTVGGYLAQYVDLAVETLPSAVDSVNIPAGQSVIYRITGAGGHVLLLQTETAGIRYNETAYTAQEGVLRIKLLRSEQTAIVELFNLSSEDAVYSLNFHYTQGHEKNPQVLTELGELATQTEVGTNGYWYTYTAPSSGVVTFQVWEYPTLENAKTNITVTNTTTQESQSLWTVGEDGEPVENYAASVVVTAGDVVTVQVEVTENDTCADATLILLADIYGAESNPIQIQYPGFIAHVPAGQTLYYCGYNLGDLRFTLTGEAVSVAHNGAEYPADGGQINFDVVAAGRMPAVFAVTNLGGENAEYTVTFAYPLGHVENPDALVLGTNLVERQAGKFDYCLNFTAPRTGKLVLTFPEDGQWLYTVNNLTQYVYGDTQYSDSDPLVAVTEIAVNAGDLVQVRVNTYDPAAPWETPAGQVSFEAAYITGPNALDNLNFSISQTMLAGEKALFTGKFQGYVLTITGGTYAYVEYNGTKYTPDSSGVLRVEFPQTGTEQLEFALYNGKASQYTYNLQFSTTDAGSALNPQIVTGGSYSMVQTVNGGPDYYYRFVAPANGTVTLTFEDDVDCIFIVNDTIYKYTHLGQTTYSIRVRAGIKINFCVNTYDKNNPMVSPEGTVDFTVSFS